jgi:hypothetical protein
VTVTARGVVTPVSLIVLAAGVATYAYVFDRHTISDADGAARRSDVFQSFRVDQVAEVELDHGAERLVLAREGGGSDAGAAGSRGWVMTSPRHEPVDTASIDALLRELELGRRLRDAPTAVASGLDAPRVRGRVVVGGLEYRFALGSDAPTPGGAAYMRLEGDGAFVVERSLKVQLLRGADAYRERALVPYGAPDVARIEVRGARDDARFAIDRSGDGPTFRIAGSGLRASREAVDRIFAALADTRAESFVEDDRADQAMAQPAYRVTIAARDPSGPRIALRVGGACPDQPQDVLVVRDAPTRVSACAPRTIVEALDVAAERLPDRSPLFAHADEIEELRLEATAGPRVELARKGRGWHERAPEDRDLDADQSESANALALALAEARATDAAPAGAAAPEHFSARARATVVGAVGGAAEVVEVGPTGANGVTWARRADDGAMLGLPLAVARRFEPHPVALRGRSVWGNGPFDAGAIVGVDNSCGPAPESLELRDRVWTMRAPAGFTADSRSVSDLGEALANARTTEWIAEADDGAFGFGAAGSCAVTVTLAPRAGAHPGSPPERAGIAFGAETGAGVYAHAIGDPAVFVIPSALRAIASHPAIDRGRFRLDVGALTSVTIERGAAKVTLAKAGDRLVRTPAGPGAAPADAGGRLGDAGDARDAGDGDLEEALASFRADAALHTGAPGPGEGLSSPTLEIRASGGGASGSATMRITIGAPTHVDAFDAYFARVSGVDATFAVPRQAVGAILDAW